MRLRNIPEADGAVAASPYVIQDPASKKDSWQSVFDAVRPLHIEIGMGKGRFLMDMAALHPEINYIGIERYTSVLYRAIQKMDAKEAEDGALSNLRFLCIDAADICDYFAEGEVDRIYLNFSDPWPKDRHAKRRLTSSVFLEKYDRILVEGGQIEFKTDNVDLFRFSLDEVNASETWKLAAHTFDLHHEPSMNEGNVMTEYEEKFSAKGNPICKMVVVRK